MAPHAIQEMLNAQHLLASALNDAKRRGLHSIAGAMFGACSALESAIATLTPTPVPPVETPPAAPSPAVA